MDRRAEGCWRDHEAPPCPARRWLSRVRSRAVRPRRRHGTPARDGPGKSNGWPGQGGERLARDRHWRYGVPPKGNANFAWVQHTVHQLAPAEGVAGFVLANGSMLSSQSGESKIRVRREVDSVEVASSAEIVYVGHVLLPLSAEPLDESGHAVPGTGLAWESSDTAVATVASMGGARFVRDVAPGTGDDHRDSGPRRADGGDHGGSRPRASGAVGPRLPDGGDEPVRRRHWARGHAPGDRYGVAADDPDRVVTRIPEVDAFPRRIPPDPSAAQG